MKAIYLATAGTRTDGCMLIVGCNHAAFKQSVVGSKTLLFDMDAEAGFAGAEQHLDQADGNVLIQVTDPFYQLSSDGPFKYTRVSSGGPFVLSGKH